MKAKILLFLGLAKLMTLCAAFSGELYVSPNGSDTNTGLGPEHGRALRTIQAAVNQLQPGDSCIVLGGVYRETVKFPRSGEPDRPIILKSYANQTVVITGCDPVKGWARHRGNIWKAPMDWTLGVGCNQVFTDNEVMLEARHPNVSSPVLELPVAGLSRLWPTFGPFSIPSTNENDRIISPLLNGQPDDHWKGAIYYGVHYDGWMAQSAIVTSSRSGELRVGQRTNPWWFPQKRPAGYPPKALPLENGRGMLIGHMSALDEAGEWHLEDRTLYLIPAVNQEPRGIEAKRRLLALDLGGRSHIRVERLQVRGAAISMRDSVDCVLDGCTVTHGIHFTLISSAQAFGANPTRPTRPIMQNREESLPWPDIPNEGATIYISGRRNVVQNCSVRFSAGAGIRLEGYGHAIHNCLVDQCSYTCTYLPCLFLNAYEDTASGGHAITFTTISNAGRALVWFGNGHSRDRRVVKHAASLFTHNHIYNGMLQARDGGNLNSFCADLGAYNGLRTEFSHNVLHDCFDPYGIKGNRLGIVYLDLASCNVDFHHNLLWATPGSLQRDWWFNTACMNVVEANNTFHPAFSRSASDLAPGDFPGDKPFQFGHDFGAPPPRPAWVPVTSRKLEAGACSDHSAGVVKTSNQVERLNDGNWIEFADANLNAGWQSAVLSYSCSDPKVNTDESSREHPRHQRATDPLVVEFACHFVNGPLYDNASTGLSSRFFSLRKWQDGSWVQFARVPFGEGYRQLRVVYGKDHDRPSNLEIRIDRLDGPIIAQVPLKRTESHRQEDATQIQKFGELLCDLTTATTGTHDLFVICRAPGGGEPGDLWFLRFEDYRGAIPLQNSEMKVEIRIDGPTGRKIGEFHPRYTGPAGTRRETIVPVRPLPRSDSQKLFLVVRSATGKPLDAIDWVALEKSLGP